jgi:hypothetical protein
MLIMLAMFSSAIGCVGTQAAESRQGRPPSSAELAMGYQDAVDLGVSYMTSKGLTGAELERADQPWPNVWCVRFGLLPKGSGRRIELYFDGTRRSLLKEVAYDGVGASWSPPPGQDPR